MKTTIILTASIFTLCSLQVNAFGDSRLDDIDCGLNRVCTNGKWEFKICTDEDSITVLGVVEAAGTEYYMPGAMWELSKKQLNTNMSLSGPIFDDPRIYNLHLTKLPKKDLKEIYQYKEKWYSKDAPGYFAISNLQTSIYEKTECASPQNNETIKTVKAEPVQKAIEPEQVQETSSSAFNLRGWVVAISGLLAALAAVGGVIVAVKRK